VTVSGSTGFSFPRSLIPAGLFLASFMVVAGTAGDYGVTWDEPAYFYASDLHIEWLVEFGQNLLRSDLDKSVQDENIKKAWHWDPYHVPHPPFSRIVSGITKALFSSYVDKFVAYRLGPALFFALLAACMYSWMADLFNCATGLFSILALIAVPNLFGFAHIAVTDMPLASMWFMTVYCFWKGLASWKWSIVLGVVWGLTLATKFPAVLIPIPLLLWAHLYYRRSYANNVFALFFLSPLIMIAGQPYLWHQPGLRILEFLFEGLSRGYRPDTSFSVFFLGQLYPSNQLPWYYPFFVIGVTTPEAILALALFGSVCIPLLREQRAPAVLFLTSASFILITGLLPGAVLHDGARQLLSVLPFLVAMAGVGFFVLFTWLKRLCVHRQLMQGIKLLPQKIAAAMMILILFIPVLDTYLFHPFQLSYYNRLVGGIRGAYLRGLEVTYFLEAFTPGFVKALNETLPIYATINASFGNLILAYYQKEGRLRNDVKIADSGPFDYYVLLNRRSVLSPREQPLINGPYQTFLSVTIAGVPLVSVFEFKKPW
jgi:hypothetical protein